MPLKPAAAHRKDLTSGLSPMQHRHFATIAAIIADIPLSRGISYDVAEHFAEMLRHTNPKFDRDRFMKACGQWHEEG